MQVRKDENGNVLNRSILGHTDLFRRIEEKRRGVTNGNGLKTEK
jgi:hypothetical protein